MDNPDLESQVNIPWVEAVEGIDPTKLYMLVHHFVQDSYILTGEVNPRVRVDNLMYAISQNRRTIFRDGGREILEKELDDLNLKDLAYEDDLYGRVGPEMFAFLKYSLLIDAKNELSTRGVRSGLLNPLDNTCTCAQACGVGDHCKSALITTLHSINQKSFSYSEDLRALYSVWGICNIADEVGFDFEDKEDSVGLEKTLPHIYGILQDFWNIYQEGGIQIVTESYTIKGKRYNLPCLDVSPEVFSPAKRFLALDTIRKLFNHIIPLEYIPRLVDFAGYEKEITEFAAVSRNLFFQKFNVEKI